MARPKARTTKTIRLVLDTTRSRPVPTSSKPDPRLVRLVRLLARQAARDFVQVTFPLSTAQSEGEHFG